MVKFSFTGKGGEYFRIWIVNLLLSIITLGIYSAWAKVRRTRYFYENTHLAGSSFDYHGDPIAILKGRIIAVFIVAFYNISFKISPVVGLIALAIMLVVMPWLVWKSLQFKLYNSSYRGIRFGFKGSIGMAYKTYLLWPLLTVLTLYLLAPFTHQRIKQFQHNESRFGTTHFSFHGKVGSFYKTYLLGLAIAVAGIVVIGLLFSSSLLAGIHAERGTPPNPAVLAKMGFVFLAFYFWIFAMAPIFMTMIQNLIWSNTKLGDHQFVCQMKWGKMLFIGLTNILGIVFTLGLFTPFARIRALRYRIESMTLLPAGDLDSFIADTQAHTSSTGEGMADLLDFGLSL